MTNDIEVNNNQHMSINLKDVMMKMSLLAKMENAFLITLNVTENLIVLTPAMNTIVVCN